MVNNVPTWIWFSCSLCALTKRHKRSLIQFYPHFAEYLFSWEQELLVQGTIHDLKNKENCNLASWLLSLREIYILNFWIDYYFQCFIPIYIWTYGDAVWFESAPRDWLEWVGWEALQDDASGKIFRKVSRENVRQISDISFRCRSGNFCKDRFLSIWNGLYTQWLFNS